MINDDEATLIHVLRFGRALCPIEGVPSDWPEGHKWVGIQQHAQATCTCCAERAKEILAEQGQPLHAG